MNSDGLSLYGVERERSVKPGYVATRDGAIVYDRELIATITPDIFEPDYWHRKDAVTGSADGRGTTWFVAASDKEHWVVRHYRRGGMFGPLLRDRYWWPGLGRSRPWREWHLLCDLHRMSMPVPRPVAARVVRRGWFYYTADLVTRRLKAQPLSAELAKQPLPAVRWESIGSWIRRFHEAGVCHADLNAHNILLGDLGEVYLIDLDKGRWRSRGRRRARWQEANISRLRRSLDKLQAAGQPFHFDERAWERLLEGYGRE